MIKESSNLIVDKPSVNEFFYKEKHFSTVQHDIIQKDTSGFAGIKNLA